MYSRRELVRGLGWAPVVGVAGGGVQVRAAEPEGVEVRYRTLGRTGRWVTPLGLGGQGSLQWTVPGMDAADIVVRAVELGVNYLDTANAYGPSQANYGEAFARLRLKPFDSEYNAALREHLFVATKTGQRSGAGAVADLRRSLAVMFGDGAGIPDGAYVDSMQIHNLQRVEDVDTIYRGALPALADYRDGTNLTGLNPDGRRWIRHIGITGHHNSLVLMTALQRDTRDWIDTLLVALNVNDRWNAAHQFNAIPVARARGVGIIAMKAFADGVFYGKPARFSNNPNDVIQTVGRDGAIDCSSLVRYPLSIPGVSTLITGIGKIHRENPAEDQLAANLRAALAGDGVSDAARRRMEDEARELHGVETNYFNERRRGLTQPTRVEVSQDGDRLRIRWNSALAAAEPVRSYQVRVGDRLLLSLPFRAQHTDALLETSIEAGLAGDGDVRVVASTDGV